MSRLKGHSLKRLVYILFFILVFTRVAVNGGEKVSDKNDAW